MNFSQYKFRLLCINFLPIICTIYFRTKSSRLRNVPQSVTFNVHHTLIKLDIELLECDCLLACRAPENSGYEPYVCLLHFRILTPSPNGVFCCSCPQLLALRIFYRCWYFSVEKIEITAVGFRRADQATPPSIRKS
jgi:hypothetical protein